MKHNGSLLEDKIKIATKSILHKIEKYQKIDNSGDLKVEIEGVKNEYVSQQIIINSKIDAKYDVKISTLKNGQSIISNKNIDIYSAYYNEINISHNNYKKGFYPDILIPIKDRISYKDNIVRKNSNQAIYFVIHIPINCQKGIYTGLIKVFIDDEYISIPLTLKVHDFILPIETHNKSAFAIWGPTYKIEDMLTNIYGSRARKAEISYFKFLLDYRISPTCLPIKDLSSPANIVNTMIKYATNKRISSYIIPLKKCKSERFDQWFDERLLRKTINLMIKKSTNELNLFKKAYIYDLVDEPDYTGQYDKAHLFLDTLKDIVDKTLNEENFAGKEEVKQSLKNLYSLITVGRWDKELDKLGNNVTGYCPKFSLFDNQNNINDFINLQKNNKHIWAYGCNFPGLPYPTYQIDADPIYQRSIGILMYRYNIEGNLFWCTNVSRIFDGNKYCNNFDPYSSFYAFSSWPGDGYLLVKAGKYNKNSIKPYPTLRLLLVREGQQDYESLYQLESKGIRKEEIENKIQNIFDGAKPINNVEAFLTFKKIILERMLDNL